MIETDHNSGPDKSFLKSKIEEYEGCMPLINMKEMHKLLNQDLSIVRTTGDRAKGAVSAVSKNYERFMKQQVEAL